MDTFFYILLGVILLIIFLGLIAPKSYDVSRSIKIKRSLSEVFNYVLLIKNQDNWSPWAERDSNMKKTHTGIDGEIGFISAWESDHKQVGSGEQELIGFKVNEEINGELRFLKPFKSTSDCYFRVNEVQNGTEVTWGFSGKNKFPISIMMLFMNMDKTVGKDFEQGLEKLKTVMENN
jgi:hypothetical protein